MEATLTDADCDLLVCTRVHPSARQVESRLNSTRWWDLRRLHPAVLLLRFVKAYESAVRDFVAVARDLEESQAMTVLKGEQNPFLRHDLISFWRARQAFDAFGIPYEWGCKSAMNRAINRGWANPPQPNELYAQTMALDVRDAWGGWVAQVYVAAESPLYQVANDIGQVDQVAYRRWLIDTILARPTPASGFARAIRDCQLTESHIKVDPRVDEATLKRAVWLAT